MIRLLGIIFFAAVAVSARAADHIVWYPKARTFDLEVRGMPLEKFLGLVRAETGWEVVMEPGLTGKVGGKFRNKRAATALRLLLGRTRFALLPRADGGTRLKVYAGSSRKATQAVDVVLVEALEEKVEAIPDEDDGRLLSMPVKVHYMQSRFPALKADTKLTNLRPLIAGVNEIWRQAGVRFSTGIPKSIRPASRTAEKAYVDLFKPDVSATAVQQLMGRMLHQLLPDLPDRGKAIHIVVIHTMPQGYGAVYLPAKGMVVMPQVKYADLVMSGGVWKNGSPVFYAQSNVLAHEFGHALSLKHVDTQGNLMIDGKLRQGQGVGPSTNLADWQITEARQQAFTSGPYVPGINPKPAPKD